MCQAFTGFDHGVGHPLLLLCHTKEGSTPISTYMYAKKLKTGVFHSGVLQNFSILLRRTPNFWIAMTS
jgi:hypothetical protein